MKLKAKKIILWGCGSILTLVLLLVIAIFSLFYYLTQDNRIAEDPTKIASRADFDLPAYVVLEQTDNMDRGTSAWSYYGWELQLEEPLTDNDLAELNELSKMDSHWSYNEERESYIYSLREEGKRYITIIINIKENSIYMSYEWWDFLA